MSDELRPQDVAAERQILNAVMNDAYVYEEISYLTPDDFYDTAHSWIWEAIQGIAEDTPIGEQTFNFQVVQRKLEANGRKIKGGWLLFLTKIATEEWVPFADLVAKENARAIAEMATRRRLLDSCSAIARLSHSKETPIEDVLSKVEDIVVGVRDRHAVTVEDVLPISSVAADVMLETQVYQNNPRDIVGMKTGLRPLDNMLLGVEPGLAYWIAGRPGMGKCLGRGTKVVRYDGRLVRVEDVRVGDLLMGVDSKPRRVLALGHGFSQMYKVEQSHGITYRVNGDHILALKRSRNEGGWSRGDLLEISVEEFLAQGPKFQSSFKGYKVAIDFPHRDVPIDPYFLGLWLGDGNRDSSIICAADEPVVEYLHEFAEARGEHVTVTDKNRSAPTYRVCRGKGSSGSMQEQLREMGLLYNKHIPDVYLYNSKDVRLALLAGLIDSDGHYMQGQGGPYEITQKSRRLATQIKYLCDSLGYRTSLSSKIATCNGKEFQVWRVRFNGNVDEIPVRIPRKRARPWTSPQDWQVSGLTITPDGVDEYFGFELDGDGLFLLEDMTVTHNSSLLAQMAWGLAENGHPVLFFSLEMKAAALVRRMICQKARVSYTASRLGRLSDIDFRKFKSAAIQMQDQEKYPLYIEDRAGRTVSTMRSIARRYADQHGIKAVFIDTINRIGDVSHARDQYHGMTAVSHAIADWAHESEYAVLVAAQLSRGNQLTGDKRPTLATLRDAGSQEEDADVVIGIHRPGYYNPENDLIIHEAELLPLKVREGATDTMVKLYWEPSWPGFGVLETRDINNLDAMRPAVGQD